MISSRPEMKNTSTMLLNSSNLSRVKIIIQIEEITINNTHHMAATRWEVKRGHHLQAKDSRCKRKMEETIEAIEAATIGVRIKDTRTKEVAAEEDNTEAVTKAVSSSEVVEGHT